MSFIQWKRETENDDEERGSGVFYEWAWRCTDCPEDEHGSIPLGAPVEEINEAFARHAVKYHSPPPNEDTPTGLTALGDE